MLEMINFPDAPNMLSLTPIAFCVTIFTAFSVYYAKVSPKFDSERKRAYLLSTLSSLTMSIISLPFVGAYLAYGIQGCFTMAQSGWMLRLGQFGVMFFGTYLFADLSIGYFKYRTQVGLLTGWIHHTVYIALMVYLYNSRQTPFFMIAAIMELPTFDLAISNLFPVLRNDLRFLSGFFVLRILFHIAILLDCIRPSTRALMDGSWVPISTMTLALVLHVTWFQGGVRGYLKRHTKKQTVRSVEQMEPMEILKEIDGTLLETLPNEGSEPGTPEDSPLITPHTPKTYAVLANLPHLPAMPHLPSLANIPNVAIPSLADFTAVLKPRDQLHFGFKDAVKNRWEEQKGRFNDIRRGGGLDLGRLGMRRRASGFGGMDDDVEVVL